MGVYCNLDHFEHLASCLDVHPIDKNTKMRKVSVKQKENTWTSYLPTTIPTKNERQNERQIEIERLVQYLDKSGLA